MENYNAVAITCTSCNTHTLLVSDTSKKAETEFNRAVKKAEITKETEDAEIAVLELFLAYLRSEKPEFLCKASGEKA